jgi:PAS domain S-box-containing protein
MIKRLLSILRTRLTRISLSIETHSRSILLAGFSLILLLITFMGYWSRRSLAELDNATAILHDAEGHEFRIVVELDDIAAKMTTEARSALANKSNPLLHFPAWQRLKLLKTEMDLRVKEGRATALGQADEWKEFENAFGEFWVAVSSDSGGEIWYDTRLRLSQSISGLESLTRLDRWQNDALAEQMTRRARERLGLVTVGALVVGLLVAGLTFFQINKALGRLAGAYRQSAQSRDYLQSLLDGIVLGVVVLGPTGRVITANNSFLAITGRVPEQPKGESYEKLFSGRAALLNAVSERLGEPSTEKDRYCCRVEMGASRLFDVYASPLLVAGQQKGLILAFVDITEAELARAELRRNRALSAIGQMTTQIAHEIKNPLGSIGFAAELLKRKAGRNAGDEIETISIIERSVGHLQTIVGELLEFSRPKKLNCTGVNLNALLDEILPMLSDRLASKAIQVEKSFTEPLPEGHYDEAELKKLFLNLIVNAIDASRSGGCLWLRTNADTPGTVAVVVEDQGVGMDSETRGRLFEPFFTTKKDGTGLGMAIAKKIAELHHGHLFVTSSPGQGTTITVKLPADPGPSHAPDSAIAVGESLCGL